MDIASEDSVDHLRRKMGFIVAPFLFFALWFIPIPSLSPEAHRLLAVEGLVITLWMTEAIPLAVTALLGPTLCVLVGVSSAKEIFKGFADPIIFLFIGSFLLAEAVVHHGLNRRIAFQILSLKIVSGRPSRVLIAFAAITGFISMWISNTATTAMMLPIGISILSEMARRQSEHVGSSVDFRSLKFGTGLMLMASFASSVGGLGTPVGTPPNLIGIGLIQKHLNIQISFLSWMQIGVPLAVIVIAILIVYFHFVFPAEKGMTAPVKGWIETQQKALGPIRKVEFLILLTFLITLMLWILPGILALILGKESSAAQWANQHLPESVAALIGAILLFFLPSGKDGERILSWNEAKQIDWGTILLFGGGIALGDLMFSTGLAKWLGEGLVDFFQVKSLFGLVLLFTAAAIIVSEITNNTAAATMVVPVAISMSQAAGVDPFPPALAACLGASFGFMMPVSTAPNALVYGTGCVPLTKMIRYGILLDIIGCIIVVSMVLGFGSLIFR
jgi:solute carrier family 13 (sodium-dependent dicarboxylate transporter), member 2/3/5